MAVIGCKKRLVTSIIFFFVLTAMLFNILYIPKHGITTRKVSKTGYIPMFIAKAKIYCPIEGSKQLAGRDINLHFYYYDV